MNQAKMPVEHALVRSTVRILAGATGSQPTSIGTGFFYKVVHPTAGIGKVLIVTNKHVVRGAEVIHFVLSSGKNRDRPRLISPNMVLQPKPVSLSLNRLG